MRDRALFDLAIDCKLRGCAIVKVRIGDWHNIATGFDMASSGRDDGWGWRVSYTDFDTIFAPDEQQTVFVVLVPRGPRPMQPSPPDDSRR